MERWHCSHERTHWGIHGPHRYRPEEKGRWQLTLEMLLSLIIVRQKQSDLEFLEDLFKNFLFFS